MGYEPLMDGKALSNVATEHVFKIRATFGASSAVTYRSKDATIAKTTTTTFTITLPKAYAEITDFSVGQKCAASVIPLQYAITTNNVATDGTLVLTTKETAAAGTATAPADGDVAYITLGVSCDPLNSKYTG
jgi:hypothetical protein